MKFVIKDVNDVKVGEYTQRTIKYYSLFGQEKVLVLYMETSTYASDDWTSVNGKCFEDTFYPFTLRDVSTWRKENKVNKKIEKSIAEALLKT